MTTFALVGAGSGLGLATAHRFGRAGHSVALIARNADRLDHLAGTLHEDGIQARGYTADVLEAATLTTALDTTATDLDDPLAFSVRSPVTCVNTVLPGMRALGRGTLLFVNGGSAVHPHPERAGTSVAFAAESTYAAMLHEALAKENIRAAQLIIPGAIRPDTEHSSPAVLAERLYAVHTERDGFRHYAEPMSE